VPRQALSLIARASNAPVFGLYESYLGFGIVGGQLVELRATGAGAAAQALRLLGGEAPDSIPFGAVRVRECLRLAGAQTLEHLEAAVPPGVRSVTAYRPLGGVLEARSRLGRRVRRRERSRCCVILQHSKAPQSATIFARERGTGEVGSVIGRNGAVERGRGHRAPLGHGESPRAVRVCSGRAAEFDRVLDAVHPADRDLVRLSTQRAVASGRGGFLEYRVLLPDGAVAGLWCGAACSQTHGEGRNM